jgi:hypothetical protein
MKPGKGPGTSFHPVGTPHGQPSAPSFPAGRSTVLQGRFVAGGGAGSISMTLQRAAQPGSGDRNAFLLPAGLRIPTTGGKPLPTAIQARLEAYFGADFSAVRIHEGPQASAIGALAFTMGSDIHFAPGRYQPDQNQGRQLLCHELAHVIQQRSGRVRNPLGGGVMVVNRPDLEAEADRLGHGAAAMLVSPNQKIRVTEASKHLPPLQSPSRLSPIQAKIDYTSQYRGLSAIDEGDLINKLVLRFGESHRSFIAEQVATMRDRGNWTMRDIVVAFNKYRENTGNMPLHREVVFSGSGNAPRPHSLDEFGFNSVTWLVGRVGNIEFAAMRNDAERHAEENFMRAVEASHAKGGVDLTKNPAISIVINNSPCDDRCARALATWVRRWKLSNVVIRFANPYGTKEEFQSAVRVLQRAGIRIHGLDLMPPLKEQRKLKEGTPGRLQAMADRLRTAKAGTWYVSDDESDDESSLRRHPSDRSLSPPRRSHRAEQKGELAGRRERSRSRDQKTVSPHDPLGRKQGGRQSEGDRIEGVGRLVNVSGENMDCLIRALLVASGQRDSFMTVRGLRDHLVSQGVAVHGRMLDLADAAGAILISELHRLGLLNQNVGIRVYRPGSRAPHIVQASSDGSWINLWLEGNHFQAILP